MNKSSLIVVGCLVFAIFLSGFVLNDSTSQNSFIAINATAVVEQLSPFSSLFASLSAGILSLAGLLVLVQKYLESRRMNKKYGESRTPVVIDASR